MDTFAQLLARLRHISGLNQSQLARAVGVTPQAVQKWESGETAPSRRRVEPLARALGADTVQLLDALFPGRTPREAGSPENDSVPLISWVIAGHWAEVEDPYAVGDAETWLPCPLRHGRRTYALRVEGSSMYNPGGSPSFAEGDVIFVDPERDAVHRSLVVVRLDDEKKATFKRLLIDGERRYLEALNPSWPERIIPINGSATLCGVVIGRLESFI